MQVVENTCIPQENKDHFTYLINDIAVKDMAPCRIASHIHGSFCVCTQPMRDDVTMERRLLLAGCIHMVIPWPSSPEIFRFDNEVDWYWVNAVKLHKQRLLVSLKLWTIWNTERIIWIHILQNLYHESLPLQMIGFKQAVYFLWNPNVVMTSALGANSDHKDFSVSVSVCRFSHIFHCVVDPSSDK